MKNITIAYGNEHSTFGFNWLRLLSNVVTNTDNVQIYTDPTNAIKFYNAGYAVSCVTPHSKDGFTLKDKLVCFKNTLLGNESFLFSDTDAIWLKDVSSRMETLLESYDMVLSIVAHDRAFPKHVRLQHGFAICTGFLASNSNTKTIKFFSDCIAVNEQNDQLIVNDLLFTDEYTLTGNKEDGYDLYSNTYDLKIRLLGELEVYRPNGMPDEMSDAVKVFHPFLKHSTPLRIQLFSEMGLWTEC